jgi:hypothetical protein
MDKVVEEILLKLGVTRICTTAAKVLLVMVMIENRPSFKKNSIFFDDLKELTKRHPSSGIPSAKWLIIASGSIFPEKLKNSIE